MLLYRWQKDFWQKQPGFGLGSVEFRKLEERYEEWIENSQIFRQKNRTYQQFKEIQNRFIEILYQDPFLPKELCFDNWAGEKAVKEFKTL